MAASGLSIVTVKRSYSLVAVHRLLLIAVASPAVEHGL